MKNEFKIDFFELSFLATATIPPVPIARTMFFNRLSDEFYHELDQSQRDRLFEWVTREDRFDIDNGYCEHFWCRFNPYNQYAVTTTYKGESKTVNAYLYNERYHLTKKKSILTEYITNTKLL